MNFTSERVQTKCKAEKQIHLYLHTLHKEKRPEEPLQGPLFIKKKGKR